jgi:hypothetical protein
MKATNNEKNIARPRFAACTVRARLLSICLRAARRAPASESVFKVHLSAGSFSHDRSTSGSQNKTILSVAKFFEGKLRGAKLKTKTHLKPGRHCANRIYE